MHQLRIWLARDWPAFVVRREPFLAPGRGPSAMWALSRAKTQQAEIVRARCIRHKLHAVRAHHAASGICQRAASPIYGRRVKAEEKCAQIGRMPATAIGPAAGA